MKNIEKYKSQIAEMILICHKDCDCRDCKFIEVCSQLETIKQIENWFFEEYKGSIKLTQFEYDMLSITKECHPNLGKLEENLYYTNLQDKGYFKNVNLSMTAKEVLENCEVES